jgi:CRP/FNR family cyclic AMP-dependent transcriptional regulator
VEYLIPYMKKETYVKGQVLFQKGDAADKIYFIQAGGITIPEIKRELTEGAIFGEVGIFTPHKTRSASAICAEHAVIYSIHIDK